MNVVLIIGATSDVGLQLAHEFAKSNNHLILAARNSEVLSNSAKDISIRYKTTVHEREFHAEDYDSHVDFFNGLDPKPDIVCWVIGYLGDQSKGEVDWTESIRIIESNYTGAVSILNIAAAYFKDKGNGKIVAISSVAAERGRQSNYLYGSAKAGLTTYLSGLRNRLHPFGVQVLTVKPGFIRSKMIEGIATPGMLTATPTFVAKRIAQGLKKGKNVIYVLSFWRLIMLIIKLIPEALFKRLKL